MVNVALILLLLAPVVIVLAVGRNREMQRRLRSETVELHVDEFGVQRELADGRREGVEWNEVTEVEVIRTNRGPHAGSGGVVVVWGDETHGCLVPIDRAQDSGLLDALSVLPGLSMRAMADALGADPEAQTVVWRRDS
jgi:hypothetical protein